MSWNETYQINNYFGNDDVKTNSKLTINEDAGKICSNYTLLVDDECDDNINQIDVRSLYVDIRDFMPFENETFEEELENGYGIGIRSVYIQKRWLIFPALVNTYHFSLLSAYQGMTYFELENTGTDEKVICDRLEVDPQEKISLDRFMVNVKMRLKNNAISYADTCESLFDGSPYEGCDEDSQGTPGSDIDCSAYAIAGSQSGTVMSITTTGEPGSGAESFRWRYRATENDGWQVLSNNSDSYDFQDQYGIYEVTGFKGGCQSDNYIFTIVDPCTDFTVAIVQDTNGYLVLDMSKAADIEWWYDDGTGYVSVQTGGSTYLPTLSGDYKVIADYDDCNLESNILAITVTDCAFDVALTDNGDGTVTVGYSGYSGTDTPIYRWEKEIESNNISVLPDTTDTITIDGEGIYYGYVSLDACEKGVYALFLEGCSNFKAYIESVIPGSGDYTLSAAAIDAPGAVDYTWYQWTSGMYAQIGTGISVVTTQVGQVKLIATSGVCKKVDYAEVAMDFVDMWYAQKFVMTGGEDRVAVTNFTLPDIANSHPDRIIYLMEVIENGNEQVYDHETAPASLNRQQYSINGQDVQFNSAYMRAGTVIVVKMRKI